MAQDFRFDREYYGDRSIDAGDGFKGGHGYSFTSLEDFLNGFMISYVGEDKIIRKANRTEVSFFAQRGLQELSYDTLKSYAAQEFEVPNSLSFILPKDYVHYTKVSVVDGNGIYRPLYPERKTGNAFAMVQDEHGFPDFDTGDDGDNDGGGPDGRDDVFRMRQKAEVVVTCRIRSLGITSVEEPIYKLDNFTVGTAADVRIGLMIEQNRDYSNVLFNNTFRGGRNITSVRKDASGGNDVAPLIRMNQFIGSGINETISFVIHESEALKRFKSSGSVATGGNISYDPAVDNDLMDVYGRRYGLDSERAQINGTYYIDNRTGTIRFGSSLAGQIVVLEYLSDSLSSEYTMIVHKFAEEALYKYVQYNLAAVRSGIPGNILGMLKKEARSAKRNAKIRLSNFKIEEFAQVLRNQNKFIKH